MDWFIARNGKVEGPLTFDAVVDAARSGAFGPNDQVWEPGADTWQLADEALTLWVAVETPQLHRSRTWSKLVTWMQAAAVTMIVSGSALLLSFTILNSIEREHPRPAKRDCALGDYLQSKCR
jgi:hypothetical protein